MARGEPGIWRVGSNTWDFERWMKEGPSSRGAFLCGGLHEGDLEVGGPLLGTPKDTLSKA